MRLQRHLPAWPELELQPQRAATELQSRAFPRGKHTNMENKTANVWISAINTISECQRSNSESTFWTDYRLLVQVHQ